MLFFRKNKKKRKTGIIIQARMGSRRLPGKSMLPLAGRPVIARIVERLSGIPDVPVIVATSNAKADDPLAEFCKKERYPFVRGDERDVLDRYHEAAACFDLDVVARITGDSPLADRGIVERMIREFLKGDFDYYTNLRPRTMPRGFGCEIFPTELLQKALKDRRPGDAGEYVVIPYVERQRDSLKIGNFEAGQDRSELRLTMDEQADYELIGKIYDALYDEKKPFSYLDILAFLDRNPDLKKLNAHVRSQNP